MLMLIFLMVGISGIVGFAFATYLCFYHWKLSGLRRWLGGLASVMAGLILAGATLIAVWPPLNIVFTFIGIGVNIAVVVATLLIILSTPSKMQDEEVTVNEYMALYRVDINSGSGA